MGCVEMTRRYPLRCSGPILKDRLLASPMQCSLQRPDMLPRKLLMGYLCCNRWFPVQLPRRLGQVFQHTCCMFALWYVLAWRRQSGEHAEQLRVNEDRHRSCWVNTDRQRCYPRARPVRVILMAALAGELLLWPPHKQRESKTRSGQ